MNFTRPLKDLVELIYPPLCIYCDERIVNDPDQLFCIPCESRLPLTDFHSHKKNELTDRLAGRIDVKYGFSMFRFSPGQPVQQIIHRIKYQGEPRLIYLLGRKYGRMLKTDCVFTQFDMIVPVPLHKRKKKKRGFNQSESYSIGLSEMLRIPVSKDNLLRTRHLASQTQKSRAERISGLRDSFTVSRPSEFIDKHLLLVDDVVTTGATLEACALELLKIAGSSISVLTLAMAT